MKSDIKKIVIQAVSVLLISFILMYLLPPKGGGNMGEIAFRFLQRHFLMCIVGLFVSDIIIFKMRRPKFVAAILSLVAYWGGLFLGSIFGILFGYLLVLFTVTYSYYVADISPLVVSAVSMVLFYNLAYRRFKW